MLLEKKIINDNFPDFYPLGLFDLMVKDRLSLQLLLLPMSVNSNIGSQIVIETFNFIKATGRKL